MSMKAEVIAKIIQNAKEAKPIEQLGNYTYDPENYNKIRGEQIMMANLQDAQNDFYTPTFLPGDVEFDNQGRLKKIGRTMPKLIDERIYTANKFKMYEVEDVVKNGKKDAEVKTHKDILVVFGAVIVNAIEKTNDLPPQVKAFRYRKVGFGWEYKGAEFIPADEARTFTQSLDPASFYKLQASMNKKLEEQAVKNVGGVSLNDL